MADTPSPSFSFSRKWSQRVNVLVGIGSLLAIVGMLNYLVARHYQRYHFSSNDRAELSPLTRRLVGGLTNDVRVVCYYSREKALYTEVRELLKEYKLAGPRLQVEMVDPLRDPGEATAVKARYNIPPNESAFVVFECQGRTKVVRQAELFDYDMQPLMTGQSQEVKRKDFKGEVLFTSAIYYITSQRAAKAYFAVGHGGPSPRDQESIEGYARFASTILSANGIEWGTLELGEGKPVPEDCRLLVIAGPRNQLAPGGVEAVQKYLDDGGRAFVLFDVRSLDRETGLESMLRRFGVRVGFDNVRDPQSISAAAGQDLVVSQFGNHPVTKPLVSAEGRVHLMLPRSITPLTPGSGGGADAPHAEALLYTSPSGIIREARNLLQARASLGSESGPGTNVCLAVAVERGGLPMVDATRGGATRIVVVGDSLFLDNQMIVSQANADFGAYAVNWLLDRSMLLADIAPRAYREYSLSMTASDRAVLRWVFLAGLPGAALAVGFLVWLRRRS
jgi:hypothetical protein